MLFGLSAIFSHDTAEGLRRLEIRLMYLLIPFPALLVMNFKPKLDRILHFFTYGMVTLSAILLINNVLRITQNGTFAHCFFHDFTALYKQHAVYYSLLTLFAVIILIQKWQRKYMLLNSLSLIILSTALFFAASKIMMVLYGIFLLYYVFLKQQHRWMKFGLLGILLLGFILIGSSESLKERFTDGLNFTQTDFNIENRQFTYDEKQNISDMELRVLLGKVGIQHMIQDGKWLLGYGLGDQQDWFDYHLMRYNLAPNWYQGHNVHNQYLDILLNLGIFGLLYFFWLIFFFTKHAIHSRDEIWVIFSIIFCIVFLFEVYLSRNKGIVFFTLWQMLFFAYYFNHSQQQED